MRKDLCFFFLKCRSLGLVFVFSFLKKFIILDCTGSKIIPVRELSLVAVRGPLFGGFPFFQNMGSRMWGQWFSWA